MLLAIAQSLAPSDPRGAALRAAARIHSTAGMTGVTGEYRLVPGHRQTTAGLRSTANVPASGSLRSAADDPYRATATALALAARSFRRFSDGSGA